MRRPLSISLERLEELAGEDFWHEVVQIDLGHWANANLRQLSIESGQKDESDRLYPWTSAFAHGQWCGVRESVFDTCLNPLHRVHRIPCSAPRTQPDVIADATRVVDKILSLVDIAYPKFEPRLAA